MKSLLLLLLVVSATLCAKEPVKVTVIANSQSDDQESGDIIEITMDVVRKDESLAKALSNAAKVVQALENAVKSHCEKYSRGKCKDLVEVGSYQIDTKYNIIRKEETFMAFIVKHELVVKVLPVEHVGELVDEFNKLGVTKIKSFEWADSQADEDEADDQGAAVMSNARETAEGLCESFGYKVSEVVEIEEQEPEVAEEEGEEEEQEEEDEDPAQYKVVFLCQEEKSPKSKKK